MQVIEQLKGMSEERFLGIYRALERDGYGPLDHEVARVLKFRLHAIRKLPLEQRARRARALIEHRANAELAYELFGSYLMASCKELVTEFLDATGVRHEEGMIDTLQGNEPAKEKLQEAIAALDERHEPADVTLYLSLCAEQWPSVPELDSLWRLRG